MQRFFGIVAAASSLNVAEDCTDRVSEEVYPNSMFVTAMRAAGRMTSIFLALGLILGIFLTAPASAQTRNARRAPAGFAGPSTVASAKAFGAAPLLHQAGLGNQRYLPADIARRHPNTPASTRVQIGTTVPVNVNEKVVNLTVKYTTPDVRTPYWSADEKNIYYSSNQDPTTLGKAGENAIAANGRYHLFYISSQLPANLANASTPTGLNDPADPNDYLFPALNANSNYITFIRSSDGKAITDPTKTWVLCYSPLPNPGAFIDPNAIVVAGGPNITFPNATGSQVVFTNIQRPTWLGNNNIIFSAILQGDPTYHIFQVNLQPTGGQSIIFQLTAGPADERNPAIAADGKTLAFDSTALPVLGPGGSEAYGPAGLPRQVAFPQNAPTTSQAVNTTGPNGQINRNIYTMNTIAIADPNTPGGVLPAYTVRQFTEREAGAVDVDNVEPAWSSLNPNQHTNPGGQVTQNEYLTYASTRQPQFDPNDTTNTTITGYTAGTLHHIFYELTSTDAGNTVTPEGAIGSANGANYLDTGDNPTTPQFDDRYPTWSPFVNIFRIAFQSDRTGDYFFDNFEGYVPTGQANNNFKLTPGRNCLFVATVIDITAPTLLRWDLNNTTGEVVHINLVKNTNEPFDPINSVRNSDDGVVPGSTIHLAVRVEDRESGLRPDKAVFLQIKNPNSKYQSMLQGSTNPAEHKEYTATPWTLFQANKYWNYVTNTGLNFGYEYEAEALGITNNITTVGNVLVNSGTMGATYFGHRNGNGPASGSSAAARPLYAAGQDDQGDFAGGNRLIPLDGTGVQPAVWLELKPLYQFDSTSGNPILDGSGNQKQWLPKDIGANQPAGGVLYGAALKLPDEPSDWYMDVILYDNAVNPFNVAEKSNAIIYDNVWGFSSAPPITPRTSDILVVADYALGQKFFNSRFAESAGNNLPPTSFGSESYYTDVDVKKFFDGLTSPDGTYSPYSPFSPNNMNGVGQYLISGVPNVLGVKSFVDGRLAAFGTKVDNYYLPDVGRYNIWRILSRGPLPTNVLSSYLPRLTTRPPDIRTNPNSGKPFETAAQTVVDAQRMVIWTAPFSGDLFVGQGTILDTQTQNNLQNFVSQGGRLFLSGQDIAFALTSNGATTNPFLANVLQVKFVGDNSGVGSVAPAGNTGGAYTTRIQNDPWTRDRHNYFKTDGTNPPAYDPPGSGNIPLTANTQTTGGDAARTVGGDFGSDDNVVAAPTTAGSSVSAFNHGGAQGMTVATYGQGVAVFASFGYETMSQDWYTYGTNVITTLGRRSEVMHNIVCALRSGTIIGQIIDTNGAPVSNALVRATTGADAILANGTAITDSNGNYQINGLQPDVYEIYGYKNGYYSQHGTGGSMHGTGRSTVNLALKPANPGSLSGFAVAAAPTGNRGGVFQSDGKTPIQGITVQALQQDLTNGLYDIVAASTTSGADGSYSLPSLPIGNYIIVANPVAQNTHYNSIVATVQVTAKPSAGFQLSAGETVNADDTVTIAENTSFFVNFFLAASPQKVVGVVEDAGNGNPGIPGAVVTATLTGSTTGATATAITDANGNYTLTLVAPIAGSDATLIPAGTYTVSASKPGYSTNSVTVVVGGNGTATITAPIIFLSKLPPGTVIGRVTVKSGQQNSASGAAGAVVKLYPIITVNGTQQPDLTTAPLTANASPALTNSSITGYDNITGVTGTETVTYNFTINNVPGGSAGNGNQYIAVIDPGANSGLTPSPAQIAVTVFSQTTTFNVNFELDPPHTYAEGVDLVSLPGDYSNVPDTAGIFGFTPLGDNNGNGVPGEAADSAIYNAFNVAEWTGSDYVISRNIKPQAGKGYFMRFGASAGVVQRGAPVTSDTFTISLTNNWNLIGNPFNDRSNPTTAAADIDLSNGSLVTYSYTTTGGVTQTNVPLSQAIFDNAVQKTAYFFTGSKNGSQYIQSSLLQGYNGYWFRAFIPVQMTLRYPGSSTIGRAAHVPVAINGKYRTITRAEIGVLSPIRTLASTGLTSWLQRISVRQGELLDTDNAFGVQSEARAGWDNRFETEKPPLSRQADSVTLSFKGADAAGRAVSLTDQVLPPSAGTKTWNLAVATSADNSEPVTVFWPNIDRLPRGVDPVLVDVTAGRRVSMRNGASSYTYKPEGRSAHAFRIEVAPPASLPLEIMNLRSVRTRGVGMGAAFRFSFVTTREADIRTQVETLSGHVVRSLNGRSAAGVDSAIAWDGRNEMGADVPAGPYVIDIRATDGNGAQVERKVMIMNLQ
jgi:hypothetical protein